ncbi:MAG TPA: hypothetical protein PKC76_06750 [Saprospiraceae bacterium]|nr:hypothetical protein [Saprospiraceae bacterium]HMP23811.1 hypothetical protein [Saprospiraceae bacterium]
MKRIHCILWIALLSLVGQPLAAQDYSKDAETIEGVMAAILDVISGPAGRTVDWDHFRYLFRGDAPLHIRAKRNDALTILATSVEGYVKDIGPRIASQDFFESIGSLTIDQYADIAQVFMVYEARRSPAGEPFDRGINSFQLIYDEGRWWIISLMWQAESTGVPIPARYLKKTRKQRRG